MKASEIDHLCVAVRDLDATMAVYEDILGLECDGVYTAESENIRVARYYLGSVALELMEPTQADSEVGRFLEKNGEGLFLISYRVEDIEKGLKDLNAKGYKTIDQVPRRLMGTRYAFTTLPTVTGGILTEIMDGDFDGSYENPTV